VKVNISGAIFDLDGTLIDLMPYWETLTEDYVIQSGGKPQPGLNDLGKELSVFEAANLMIEKYDIDKTPQVIADEINDSIDKVYESECELKSGVLAFLEKLFALNVKMCIVTASCRKHTEVALKRLGIEKYFSFIITNEDFGKDKITPEIFEYAMRKLGAEIETTFVFEDSDYAVKPAKAAGLKVVAVYDKYAVNIDTIKKYTDYYVHNLEELL
jgi:HAD superfamily hydrolase (TIGR01509 family)